MVVDVKPAKGSLDATPSEVTDASEPGPSEGAVTPRRQVVRPAIDPRHDPLAHLATRWPHIEAEVVRRQALARRRR